MTHPFDIIGLVANLKASADMLRLVGEGYSSMDVTEARLKLVSVSSTLLDAMGQLTAAEQALRERDARITILNDALEIKATVVRVNDAYYRVDESGNPLGQPYCVRCWENDHKLRGLVRFHDGHLVHRCQTCQSIYDEGYSGVFPSS